MAPEPKPKDRTPRIECDICGGAFDYTDYWAPRFTMRDDPRQSKTECDRRQERAAEMYDRLSNNRRLSDYE